MLETEQRRQIVLAAITGLCANPEVMRDNSEARVQQLVRTALRIAFELERSAPDGSQGIGV